MPTKDDDGGHLVCSAENLRMTNSTIEAQWPLKVYCKLIIPIHDIFFHTFRENVNGFAAIQSEN